MTSEQELELLRAELARGNGEPDAICTEDIEPSMTPEKRERTLEEILRVLGGEQ
jgi:hypothetical protein